MRIYFRNTEYLRDFKSLSIIEADSDISSLACVVFITPFGNKRSHNRFSVSSPRAPSKQYPSRDATLRLLDCHPQYLDKQGVG